MTTMTETTPAIDAASITELVASIKDLTLTLRGMSPLLLPLAQMDTTLSPPAPSATLVPEVTRVSSAPVDDTSPDATGGRAVHSCLINIRIIING